MYAMTSMTDLPESVRETERLLDERRADAKAGKGA